MPVIVRGQSVPSLDAAAEVFGVKRTTIWKAIDEGRAHRFGERPSFIRRKPKPVTICGRVFASRAEASAMLGISLGWLTVLVRRTDRRAQERLLRAVMAYEARVGRRAA
jgi:predicted DNA-binding transcriptional regulator AlpA